MELDPEPRWACDVVLKDGRPIHLRPAEPRDRELLRAFHAGLSRQTVYFRYFTAKPRLPDRYVDTFTRVDPSRHMVLFAFAGDVLIAMASYDRCGDTDSAEVAFVVDDAHQGRGLGTVLLEHLASIARTNGIHHFVADTLAENDPMLAVFHDTGFTSQRKQDQGVVHLSFPIDPTVESASRIEGLEHRAEAVSIARLLAPRSVAVVGAGRSGGVGREILDSIVSGNFHGAVHPVNRHAGEVAGRSAHRSLARSRTT
jgi:GNAT superfamily N-acetyltransferase